MAVFTVNLLCIESVMLFLGGGLPFEESKNEYKYEKVI